MKKDPLNKTFNLHYLYYGNVTICKPQRRVGGVSGMIGYRIMTLLNILS